MLLRPQYLIFLFISLFFSPFTPAQCLPVSVSHHPIHLSLHLHSNAHRHNTLKLIAQCCPDVTLITPSNLSLTVSNILRLPYSQYRSFLQFYPTYHPSPSFHLLPSPPLYLTNSKSNPEPLSDTLRQSVSLSKADSHFHFYRTYHHWQSLYAKWTQLANEYDFVNQRVIGQSFEARPIVALEIGYTNPDNPKRIFINSLQHAREWITCEATTFIAEVLALSYLQKPKQHGFRIATLLQSVQVIIVPIVNPDGYIYSHEHCRYWRKNRTPHSKQCESPCLKRKRLRTYNHYGVDLNRNWGKDYGGRYSTSTDPCHETFVGAAAFSEPETLALYNFIKNTTGIKAHIDFHSYGQVILGPWASSDDTPLRSSEIDIVARDMRNRMYTVAENRYTYGRGASFRPDSFAASGTMSDWVHSQGILSYTIELRPGSQFLSQEGFDLPEAEILLASKEAFAAVETLLRYADDSQGFLKQFVSQTPDPTPVPADDAEGGASNDIILTASFSATAGLLAIALACTAIFVIRRRVAKRGDRDQTSFSAHDEMPQEAVSLESVGLVIEKIKKQPIPRGRSRIEGNEASSSETLNLRGRQPVLLSTVTKDCTIDTDCRDSQSDCLSGSTRDSLQGDKSSENAITS